MDIYTSTDGEIRDTMPPYVGGGHRGRPMNLSYTEEVAGSSPVSPTYETVSYTHLTLPTTPYV